MTISDEITKLNTNLTDSYTAVSNKGGTLPASENFDNLPNAINSITELKGETKTVTPTTSQQTITPSSGKNGITQVTVNAVTSAIDNNITAGNIKSGVSILGVNGTVTELKGETRSVSITSTSGNTFTPTSGKNGITSITVTPTNQARTVTPTTSQQTLSVNSGYSGNGTITVNAVTSAIDSDIQAGNIKSGVNILGVNGTVTELAGETRTVSLTSSSSSGQTFTPSSGKNGITSITVKANNQARTVTPSTSSQSLTVNSGYSGNGTVTVNAVTSSIDNNITAGNIKDGVTILGVTGNYTGTTPTLTTKNITQNGTYNASSDNADGYSSVTVNVSGGGGALPKGNYYVMNDDSIEPIYFSDVTIGSTSYQNVCLSNDFTTMNGTESGVIYTHPKSAPADYHGIALSAISYIEKGNYDPIDISNVKHINLSGITGFVSMSGANRAFRDYFTSLKSVDLSRATSCKLTSGFVGAGMLESVDLSSLSDLSTSLALAGSVVVGGAFAYTAVKTLSFPSLNSNSFGTRTNQFNQMLKGVTGCTVHFPSNLQSVIGSWTSVTGGFGGTNTTVLFDLPATT